MAQDSFEHIQIERHDAVATVTINRPRVRNALARQTKRELAEAFRALGADAALRVIVLTGAGEQSFCAGTDVREMQGFSVLDAERMLRTEHELYDAIRRAPQPVIAMVNGHALGGGCALVMACDHAVAVAEAQFGLPEIRVGVPAPIEVALLPWLVGLARAREMVLLGESMPAEEALRVGLINRVVPRPGLPGAVGEISGRLAQLSPTALRIQKELLNRWIESDLRTAVEMSIHSAAVCFATSEPQNAIQGFLDRRAAARGAAVAAPAS